MHVVAYPVRAGDLLNVVAIVQGQVRDRWQDWDRSPFTSESEKHVSVWQKPGPRC
jgi:hypothetical protein